MSRVIEVVDENLVAVVLVAAGELLAVAVGFTVWLAIWIATP